jgi:putative ABC transport system ATP-binding protein
MLVTHDAKVAARSERVLFMLDGRIAAEKVLGKESGNSSSARTREEELGAWLLERGNEAPQSPKNRGSAVPVSA